MGSQAANPDHFAGYDAGVRRVVFSIVCGVSLLLLVASDVGFSGAGWVRDIVGYVSPETHNYHIAQSLLGNLHIISHLDGGSTPSPLSWQTDRLAPNAIWNGGMSSYPVKVQSFLGHVWQNYTTSPFSPSLSRPITMRYRLIVIPYRSPAMLFAILPAIWVWRFVKYGRRRKAGHCPKCDYDLRATPERCPECGWTEPASS
jgi:hypothetical protein